MFTAIPNPCVLFQDILTRAAEGTPAAIALTHAGTTCDYANLNAQCKSLASVLIDIGLRRGDRVAIYLPKQFETVISIFGTAYAGGVFVPINPILKRAQVGHILRDCNVRVLVTSPDRMTSLQTTLSDCPELREVVIVGAHAWQKEKSTTPKHIQNVHDWHRLMATQSSTLQPRAIDLDMAAILYTSGSTGNPKGVVLSHRNLLAGAQSVAQYLSNDSSDRLLALLPLSFDYGLSQLSTAFHVGATVVLLDHLFARDVLTVMAKESITGLAAVPPLWAQLADLPWPREAATTLRYITNSGGAMPAATLRKLQAQLPTTQIFLMYGLTEAFRSTYLPPADIERKPGSIGKAIPNAEVLVVRPDGSECAAHETGELVHRGATVAMGYWNAPELTAQRFRQAPKQPGELAIQEPAVWSGDFVRKDDEGYIYFLGRQDEQIKSSGYRISPLEIEEIVLQAGVAKEAVAVGLPHETLGQVIAVIAVPIAMHERNTEIVLAACRDNLPTFMVPSHLEWRDELPRNANGKYDRQRLAAELRALADNAS